MERIKVLLVDDHMLFIESLQIILKARAREIDVVGVAFDGREAINLVAAYQPDVVLMDVRMEGMDGVESTRIIREKYPSARVLMLTTFDDDEYVENALRIGAVGYLLKDVSSAELIAAIKAVYEGGVMVSPKVAARLVEKIGSFDEKEPSQNSMPGEPGWFKELSNREKEVLRLIAQGMNNNAIAKQLHIGKQTVKNYCSVIYCKMGVRDRVQAALKAKEICLDKEDKTG